jgi:hypothetical protein
LRLYRKVGVIWNVYDDEYDGGDYCAGLMIGYHGKEVFLLLFGNLIE